MHHAHAVEALAQQRSCGAGESDGDGGDLVASTFPSYFCIRIPDAARMSGSLYNERLPANNGGIVNYLGSFCKSATSFVVN